MPPQRAQNDVNAIVRDWLRDVMRHTGLRATPLAKLVGIAPSTLLRALDEQRPGSLERRTIDRIVAVAHVSPPPIYGAAADATARPLPPTAELSPAEAAALPGLSDLTNTQTRWHVHTRALELAGYLPGDIVICDAAATPRPRDAVVARITDGSSYVTHILRLIDPPFLLSETANPDDRSKPHIVDNHRVSLLGVVVLSIRLRA